MTRLKFRKVKSAGVKFVLLLCALFSILVTGSIVVLLVRESLPFFQQVSLVDFLTDRQWTPLFDPPHFGILPLLSGTLLTTVIALLVAIPLGATIAIYLSEYVPYSVREILKPLLELLSAVPTVVYGYFALLFVSPILQKIFPSIGGSSVLSAGLVMGIMIIPYVSSLSEDAMRSVPMHLREGSYAMGATRLQTAIRVVLPASFSGIASAYILALSRAIGETMIVTIAAGMEPRFTFNPLNQAATMTSYIANVANGDLPYDSMGYQSVFAVGFSLFLMTLLFNILGYLLRKRFREVY